MEKIFCPFGVALLKARTERHITQWRVASTTGYHVTNLNRVEKGHHQPGIGLAVRLVEATGADVGIFFEGLWRDTVLEMPEAKRHCSQGINFAFTQCSLDKVRCVFGPLFLQARLQTGVTQKAVADLVCYSLRNIGKIEKGQQEPGVMIALGMVGATGVDVRSFFSTLHEVTACHRGI